LFSFFVFRLRGWKDQPHASMPVSESQSKLTKPAAAPPKNKKRNPGGFAGYK